MELIKNKSLPQLLKLFFLAILGSVLLAISSKFKIPFYPVPMTMQTFVVVLIGMLYGWKLGLFTISLYLFEGTIGLPVFAGTPEKGVGLIYFIGPTMGYLLGFLPAVLISGYYFSVFKKQNKNFQFIKFFLLFSLSMSSIYILGILWLSKFVGWDKVFLLGVQPFLLAEIFKITILSILAKFIIVKITT